MSICLKSDFIFDFLYETKAPTYQFVRFTDWVTNYVDTESEEVKNVNLSFVYAQKRVEAHTKVQSLYPAFKAKLTERAARDKLLMEKELADESRWIGLRTSWMAYDNPDVLEHYPPQYIIGSQIADPPQELLVVENEHV